MANVKTVMNKIMEMHGKAGGGKPVLPLSAIRHQLQLTPEETRRHILELKSMKIISFADSTGLSIQLTKEGKAKR
jgi:hypothetical protein